MSIVDEALQKLGQNGSASATGGQPDVSAHPMMGSVAHELYVGRRPAPRGRPWTWVVGLVMLLLGVGAWWVMDRAAPKVAAPAPVAADKAIAPVVAPEPVAAATPAPPAQPVSIPAPVPAPKPVAVAVAPSVAPAAAPVTASAVPVTSAPVAAGASAVPAALPAISAPEWLRQGWRLADQGNSAQAVDAWETGLGAGSLKGRQVVYSLAYQTLPMALVHARRMGATAPALVAREATSNGGLLYRVLLLGDAQVTALDIKRQLLAQAPYLWVAPVPHVDDKPRVASASAVTLAPVSALPVAPTPAPKTKAVVTVPTAPEPAPKAKSVAAVPAAPEPGSATVHFAVDDSATRVMDTLARGDMVEATRQAEQLIAAQPGRWEGHFVLGSAMLAGGRAQEAEAPLERALELQPNSVKVLMQRAIAAQEAGKPAKAVGMLRQARTLAPNNVAVWLNLGYSAELAGNAEEAVSAYQRYLQLSSGRAGAEAQRAYVSERLRALPKP